MTLEEQNNELCETWVDRVQAELEKLNMSERALSVKAGLGDASARGVLLRGRGAKIGTITKLANALDVSFVWLLTGIGPKHKNLSPDGMATLVEDLEEANKTILRLVKGQGR